MLVWSRAMSKSLEVLDLLIVAAHSSELVGLGAAFGSVSVRGLHVDASEIGVGLPAACVGTMRSLRDRRPRAVILLGSCGLYPETAAGIASPLLTPVIPESVQLLDLAVATSTAAFPDPMPRATSIDRTLADGLASFAPNRLRGALGTTLGITTSDEVAHSLEHHSQCATENLEALGVALACESERVSFATLLVVTNIVGARGRKDWREQRVAAAERGGRILLDWLEAGAPGFNNTGSD
jgi:nucleoside phosphorylase